MKGLIALAATLASWAQAVAAEEGMDGAALYQQNCASCHGTELQGQPDGRSLGPDGRLPAPPMPSSAATACAQLARVAASAIRLFM